MRALASAAALVLALLVAPSAWAQGTEGGGFGLGAQATLTGLGGPSLAYQAPAFHVEGILGFRDDDTTEIDLVGRFWWHLHSTAASDLSFGGGLGFQNVDFGDESELDLHVEVGAQIRAFLAANVALSATVGLAIESGEDGGDDDIIFLAGQLVGGLGVTYYFF